MSTESPPKSGANEVALPALVRAVVLAQWQFGPRYRDRHPQGVIYYRPDSPGDFAIYKSHRSIEKATQAAADLNRDLSGMLDCCGWPKVAFEAVTFHRPNS